MSLMAKLGLGLTEGLMVSSGIRQEDSQFMSEYRKFRSEVDVKCHQTTLIKLVKEKLYQHYDDFEYTRQIIAQYKQQIEQVLETLNLYRHDLTYVLQKYDKFLEEMKVEREFEDEILHDAWRMKNFYLMIVLCIDAYERCFAGKRQQYSMYVKRLRESESRVEVLLWSMGNLMKAFFSDTFENEEVD